MKIKTIFLVLFILIFAILNICVGAYTVRQNSVPRFLYFLIMQIINIGIAYRLAELILSVIVKKSDLPRIDKLIDWPPVALLYVTYNDAMIDLIHKLKYQTYKDYDIFILDDSTNKEYIEKIDSCGLKVLRRENRIGFKAGSLNNWLSLYGARYQYFIIADSDSIFEDDFIENMVKYAEHKLNKDIAIFQSKILPWNIKNSFPKVVGTMVPLSMYFSEKLGNECETIISWGHNNLHRTKMVIDVGGFDENFIAEDYATGLNLIKKGYGCKIVDIVSYDALPETILGYKKRYIRWAKQTLQLSKYNTNNISFYTKLHVLIGVYSYIIWIIYFVGTCLAIWGFSSSLNDVSLLIGFFYNKKGSNNLYILNIIILFYLLNFIILRLPLALKLKISLKDYYKSFILNISVHAYIMFPLMKEMLKTMLGGKIQFDVTEKFRYKLSFIQIMKEMGIGAVINIFLLIGLIRNPLFLVFNFIWLVPLLISPIVVYFIQSKGESIA